MAKKEKEVVAQKEEPRAAVRMNAEVKHPVDEIGQKLDSLQSLLEKQIQTKTEEEKPKEEEKEENIIQPKEEDKNARFMKLLHNAMVDNEVSEEYANQIMDGLEKNLNNNTTIEHLLSSIYQKTILKFGQPQGISKAENNPKVVFFIGPTGVGKTTTIAKIASRFCVEEKAKVALLTTDTYRIAAAEQLRTYANILEVPFRIIYTADEVLQALTDYKDHDLILIDTAGRLQNKKNLMNELSKIDRIITKSVSRFARNTADSLINIRKLKDNGVEVYFEKENIWTFDSKGELMLTLMSSLAQEESRSISENVTWSVRKRFADGRVSVAYSSFLGYEKGQDGNLVINPEEAKVVVMIYQMFMGGKSPVSIANQLTKLGIPTPGGKTEWRTSTVKSILTNEKYKGDALLQKYYTVISPDAEIVYDADGNLIATLSGGTKRKSISLSDCKKILRLDGEVIHNALADAIDLSNIYFNSIYNHPSKKIIKEYEIGKKNSKNYQKIGEKLCGIELTTARYHAKYLIYKDLFIRMLRSLKRRMGI